jgi:formyl-CoA transferase
VLAVAVGNDRQFQRLSDVLGVPELAADARFATNPGRVAHRAALVAALEAALAQASSVDWEQRLTAAGVPAGVVGDIGTGVRRATELGLAPLLDLGEGRPPQIRHPVTYRHARPARPTPAPKLGEHTALLRGWLSEPAAGQLPHPSH